MIFESISWSASAILLVAILITVCLNARSARIRAFGTLLSSFCLFAFAAWVFWAFETGIPSDPRPARLPTDALKPAILLSLSGLAMVGGLLLLWATGQQMKRLDATTKTLSNAPGVYGLVSRYIHWVTAILVLTMIPMGIFATLIPQDVEWQDTYYGVHKTIGFLALGLVVVRLVWHQNSPPPSLSKNLVKRDRLLAKVAHRSLYVLLVAFPLSGYLMSSFGGNASAFFGLEIAPIVSPNQLGQTIFGALHKLVLPTLFFLFIFAHILGVLKHHFVDKDRASINRMVS